MLATLLGGYYLIRDEFVVTLPILGIGVITGCAYIASMLAMPRALERGHVAPVLTAFRLSILVPVVAGVLVWNKRTNAWQTLGIVAVIISMLLMTYCKSENSNGRRNLSTLGWMLLVFLMQGLVNCGNRWVHYAGLSKHRLLVLFVISSTAALIGIAVVITGRYRPKFAELQADAGIGVYNLLVLGALLTALSKLPATVLFPIHGCTILMLDNLFAHFFWRERLNALSIAGVILGVVSIPLVTMGGTTF